MKDSDWFIVDAKNNKHIGCEGSKYRMSEFFKHYGIFPRGGEQICVQLVEVVGKKKAKT